MAARNQIYFLLDTLEYLRRGGCIGAAKALVGGILQVKTVESQRTRSKAVKSMFDLVVKDCPRIEESLFCIQEGGAKEEALELAGEFIKIMGFKDIPIYTAPPAILVHGGPGVVGVSYFVE